MKKNSSLKGLLAVLLSIPSTVIVVALPVAGDVLADEVQPWQPVIRSVLYAVVAVGLLAALVLDPGGVFARLLGARPVVWLGEISYEIFLVHVIVMEITMASVLRWPVFTGSMPGLLVSTVLLSIPVAWVLHRFTRVRRRTVAAQPSQLA